MEIELQDRIAPDSTKQLLGKVDIRLSRVSRILIYNRGNHKGQEYDANNHLRLADKDLNFFFLSIIRRRLED